MAVTIDNIPVYQALVDDKETGMLRISLVDSPAVMSDFQKFREDRPVIMYRVEDEEKRLVRGVVMRADFPIYRKDARMGEYYIIYSAETIRIMAEKYLLEARQNNVNLMHEEGSDVEGVQMVQYYIKDSGAGISPQGFDDIADGSLFAEFHVVNDEVWDEVKAGTYKGFSLEGIFDLVPETDAGRVRDMVDRLNGKFNTTTIETIMSKMKKFKQGLRSLLMELGSVTTDKGIISWDSDDDLKAGDSVYMEDSEGNRTLAPDGDYRIQDGKIIKVQSGKVTEIVDDDAEVDSHFGSKETDKGVLQWDGEADLKAGDAVYVEKDGERVPAPDGDYKTGDGKVIKVADGKVTEIVDDEAEVAGKEQQMKAFRQAFSMSYSEKTRKIADVIAQSGKALDFWIEDARDDFAVICSWDMNYDCKYFRFAVTWNGNEPVIGDSKEVRLAFVPVDQEIVFKAEKDRLEAENARLKSELEKLSKTPAGRPAHEEFNMPGILSQSGNTGIDALKKVAGV